MQQSDPDKVKIVDNIKPLMSKGKVAAIWGTSLDVSPLVNAQKSLKRSKKNLKKQKNKLEKKNITLKELIVHVELDKIMLNESKE